MGAQDFLNGDVGQIRSRQRGAGMGVGRPYGQDGHACRDGGIHDIHGKLLPPPEEWSGPFAELASDCGLSTDFAAGFDQVTDFIAPMDLSASGRSDQAR